MTRGAGGGGGAWNARSSRATHWPPRAERAGCARCRETWSRQRIPLRERPRRGVLAGPSPPRSGSWHWRTPLLRGRSTRGERSRSTSPRTTTIPTWSSITSALSTPPRGTGAPLTKERSAGNEPTLRNTRVWASAQKSAALRSPMGSPKKHGRTRGGKAMARRRQFRSKSRYAFIPRKAARGAVHANAFDTPRAREARKDGKASARSSVKSFASAPGSTRISVRSCPPMENRA